VLLWLLAVAVFLTRAVYIYGDGMPEPDSVMVAAGVALGATGHMPFSGTFLYGKQLNPGIFLCMRAVYHVLWSDPRHLAWLLNWICVAFATLTLLPLYSLYRVHLRARAALLACAIWAFTPLVWEAHTYFHPMIPATFFLMLAIDCGRRSVSGPRMRWGYAVVSCLLASAALSTRTEIGFALPAVTALALIGQHRQRSLVMLLACLVVSGAVYAVIIHATAGEMATGSKSIGHFWDRYRQLYGMSFSLRGIPRSAAWAAMGLGLGTLLACLAAFVRRPRQKALLLAGLIAAAPSLIFWLPFIVPELRHYYLSSIGLAWLLGLGLLARLGRKHATVVAAIVMALNLGLPEIAYRQYNRTHPTTTKTPHGTFFFAHEFATRDVDRLIELRNSALGCGRLENGKSGSITLCRWDVYANMIYGIASQGTNVDIRRRDLLVPEVGFAHYTSDNTEVQLISYLYMDDARVRAAVEETMMNAWRAGNCVWVPRTVAPFDSLAGLMRVVVY
jgi:hypothetical protein